jgi:hypothetical protein
VDAVAAFRMQARACAALGSAMYGELLGRLADDLEAGGPTRRVLEGHEDDPGPSALALRLLGSVHRLVLERRAGELATYYPSVGGTWEADGATAAFLRLVDEQPEDVRAWLDRPPQTNEVGRSAALMGGLLQVPLALRLQVRLFEIGCSGGLNLLADLFAYVDSDGAAYGHAGSSVVLEPAWLAAPLLPWPDLALVERVGCDAAPVDVTTSAGRLALTAYVWPDQTARFERLRAALAIAQGHPPDVRRQGAADFVEGLALEPGTLTVLWHSVMWQYVETSEQERITHRIGELGEAAHDGRPFAHLCLEPGPRGSDPRDFLVVLTTWPGGERRVLGACAPHGLPVTWGRAG